MRDASGWVRTGSGVWNGQAGCLLFNGTSTGIEDDTIVRINRQGDIEIRRTDRWDVIGGLLGDYEHRIKHETGLDWAE